MSILDDARAGMNPEIRPQDDLFGHVNGVWLDTEKIPDDRSSWGPFVQLVDVAEQQVKDIIQELAEQGGDNADARRIAALYASFMDEETIAAKGLAPAQPLLDQVAAISDTRELAAFLGRFERVGGSGVFGAYVDTDDKNSDRYIFNILQGGLGLPDESYYREDKFAEIREKYVGYLTELLGLAGHATPAEAAASVLDLETKLAAGHWERAETRDVQKTYNLKTLDELIALAPEFDWRGYIDGLGGSDKTIAETCVRQPSYLTHLSGLLTEVEIGQWRDWVLARVLRACAPYLTDDFVNNNFEFYGRTLNGTPELRARWKRGVSFVEGAVGEAVGKEYVARHFPPSSKAMMDELVANLLEAYRQSISRLDWMTDETKERAYEKLATFRPKIGYPDKFRDYSKLEVSADDLLGNAQAAAAFESDRELGKIGSPVDRDEWFMLPQTVNAYYNPGTNEICFPAGILQKPFFSPDADPAENYGGIGAVIGHEIGHGFDDQGAQYDGAGNLNDWWTADDKTAFEAKSQALVKQYNGFSPRNLPGEFVNGQLTVGENIGDLGGLTIGHTAYKISLDGADVPVKDGLTGSQRLFMNWAFCWRTKRRKEQEQQYLTIDPHSPPEFRANIVRNLDEFHEAFGTAEGDGLWLDPAERVRIW
ncbi:M13 family metallopeptidase [Streptomyces indicus]|uniref:Endothelin-converting enzyme/putative endopeptidase n=1 Tax=Streptomyces indicus TaxID=417292 RepID=A0A1G8ZNX7_9ACTN|nr:M13-type metalloendopeptidase [Streptomyces indicus]SDK16294.1 endothelin-converting enzyme/putative endopeptidase [Streptomyces indicus]